MAGNQADSWGVVATVAEPASLLIAFVAHHLDLGAERVHIYLDRPNPEFRAMVEADQRVVVVDLTEAFFRAELDRRRPPLIIRRQILAANHALSVTPVDWLLHLDADEFLTGANPASELAALPDDEPALHIPNGERVFIAGDHRKSIFDGPLALPITRPEALRRLRGEDAIMFTAGGLLAHALGKTAHRARRGPIAGIHRPRKVRSPRESKSLRISHFDGLTPLHWALKVKRHIDNGLVYEAPSTSKTGYRSEQFLYVRDRANGLDDVLDFHDRLRVLPDWSAQRMRRRGWLVDSNVDAQSSLARQFPEISIDLSPQNFDANLLHHYPQLAAVSAPDSPLK